MEKPINNNQNKVILALGAESAGNFSVFFKGNIFHSKDFGSLLEPKSFARFQKSLLDLLKKEKIKPNVIITDLHPLYITSVWGKELAKKFKAQRIEVQHHIAHIFSQLINLEESDKSPWLRVTSYELRDTYGIALDGTGYGLDGKIWGGEVFKVKSTKRIGHLENQILIGGEMAIREPARMLISILSKFLDKEDVYAHTKKYYSKNQFELLWNQLQQNFNCAETSSTGRILDAVSVLLGFAKNERNAKHEATYLLEKNSTKPYTDLRPKLQITNDKFQTNSKSKIKKSKYYILLTTPLFRYLIKNLHKDKGRLAATAQLYIAQGLHEIIKGHEAWNMKHGADEKLRAILSGGIGNNKIIYNYFKSQGIFQNKNSYIARGDSGLSIGQINYFIQCCE